MASTIEADIEEVLNTHLETISLTPSVDFAYDLVTFTPTDGKTYLEASLMPNALTNFGVANDDSNIFRGIYQVAVMYARSLGAGGIKPNGIASQVADHFPKGTKLTGDLVTVEINQRPSVHRAMKDGDDRIRVPISILYYCSKA